MSLERLDALSPESSPGPLWRVCSKDSCRRSPSPRSMCLKRRHVSKAAAKLLVHVLMSREVGGHWDRGWRGGRGKAQKCGGIL